MNRINLFSKEWCELVFAGKNKNYGAYRIRMESTKRHIKAMTIVFLSVALLILLNSFLSKTSAQNSFTQSVIVDAYNFTNLEQDKDKPIDPIIIETPPVPIIESIKFLELVIAPDAEVKAEDMMVTQEALSETKATIASVTHEGNTDGPGVLITDLIETVTAVVPVVDNRVHEHVEQMPEYPGGTSELMSFLGGNLVYPVVDQEIGTQGTVTVRFVINKDGSVGDLEILRSLSPNCDKEAIRVIKKMKNWIPGKQNGVPVRVYFTLPVRFRLSN